MREERINNLLKKFQAICNEGDYTNYEVWALIGIALCSAIANTVEHTIRERQTQAEKEAK